MLFDVLREKNSALGLLWLVFGHLPSPVFLLDELRRVGQILRLRLIGQREEIAYDHVRPASSLAPADHLPLIMRVQAVINGDFFARLDVAPGVERVAGADRIGRARVIGVASGRRQYLVGIGRQFAEMVLLPRF